MAYKSAREALHKLVDVICDKYEKTEKRDGYIKFFLDQLSIYQPYLRYSYTLVKNKKDWSFISKDNDSGEIHDGIYIMG